MQPPDLACAVHARGLVGNDLRQALNKCGAIRQVHYFLNERGEREAFVTFKYKSDAVYAKTKHSFGDVQIFGIVDDFWKNRYVESQNADPEKSGLQQINDYDTFMPHPIVRGTPAPGGDDYISDPAGFVVHVEGEVHGTPADNKFIRFGPVRQILRFGATSGRPHAFIVFETRIGAAAARNQGHIDQLPIDALSRSEWMMKKYRELIQQDHSFSNGSGSSDPFPNAPPSPSRSPRRAPPVVYERNSWTRETDLGRAPRGPPPYNPPPPHTRSRAPEPPRHEPRPYPDDGRVLAGPRTIYRDEPRMPVDRPPSQPYPSNGNSSRESIGWKDGRDYPPPPPSGYERERMTPPGYPTSDPRYDPPLPPSRTREYDDRAGRPPPPRESARYSPYPPPRATGGPYPPRERVPLSPGPGYPPPPPPMPVDDVPRRERALSNDSRRMAAARMEAPLPPKTLSPTATSEEALNTLKFMRDMQCQPGQYLIAAEKEPRFADAEALALEGIKVAISASRPSEAAPLYLFLARLQGERFKTERNPALVLRLARDVVVNLDEASALSRQPLESAMQNLRQEMWAYTRSRASDADVEMLDISRSGEDPNTQIQRLMDKLRRAREDMRRMEDDLDRERRERRRLQGQLADVQDNLARTTRAAKSDVEDLKKANDRHLERIVELERISRSSRHKRSATGAQRPHYRKKRKFELGRQPASTKLGPKRVHSVRVRGGNLKHRALRLETGNFAWGSEQTTRKTRLIGVVYNASNNELVRTNTLVKGAIIQVDATPFRQWYEAHYAQPVTKRGAKAATAAEGAPTEEVKKSKHVLRTLEQRKKTAKIDPLLESQFAAGRLYAAISSRPGQSGRADGYILEGRELEFYLRKLRTGKQKHAQ
ncbi:40S ribosomal protein S8 [Ictalurus punctatus] [Rhizoctonia solani]|uniref:40S ribosomal protein S8 n=1 Tax=Rhizoctonia solani TaxID=456999 RepID=A0A0K6G9X5_9AGAM|nr:40S ribosomal protein S8 [Ictalurus punctatus] [Rhizoctonia solani]